MSDQREDLYAAGGFRRQPVTPADPRRGICPSCGLYALGASQPAQLAAWAEGNEIRYLKERIALLETHLKQMLRVHGSAGYVAQRAREELDRGD